MDSCFRDAILLFLARVNLPMKLLLRILLALTGLLLLAGVILWWAVDDKRGTEWAVSVIRDRFPEVKQISPQDLNHRMQDFRKSRPVLLDARSADEFAVSHLQGAIHLDEKAVTPDQLSSLDPQRAYVVYCSAGYRSCLLAKKLQDGGFTQVQNLEGGIFAWANDGHAVWQGEEIVHEVHPYHPLFSRLLKPELRPR